MKDEKYKQGSTTDFMKQAMDEYKKMISSDV